MENIIEINNLNYQNIFQNFSISFPKNKFISLAGSNNSGKTTLLRILDKKLDNSFTLNAKNASDYKITDYYKTLRVIIPNEFIPLYETVDEEVNNYLDQLFLSKDEKNKRLKSIYKHLSLNRIKKEKIKDLSKQDFIKLQIAIAVSIMPKVIIIDDISTFFSNDEVKEITDYFKYLIASYDITIILTTSRLDDVIDADFLYIISDSKVVLEGTPIEVMQKDNILNRVGIKVPFMIDLSVKLKDYALINDIELDMNRMVDILWK